MSFVCLSCVSFLCHLYVFVCHLYVNRVYSYVIRISFVSTRISFASHSHVIRKSLVCYSYLLVCHSYVTSMYWYVTRMCFMCSFVLKQTIFLLEIKFQLLWKNSAFHPRWNSIFWYSTFFIGLLVCHTFLGMADDFGFFL